VAVSKSKHLPDVGHIRPKYVAVYSDLNVILIKERL
jgi:hypothetical protein